MRQNPCRYCALAYEDKHGHTPRWTEKCLECENWKKHEMYLLSKRKFISGETITSVSELLDQEWVMWGGHTKHIETFKSMQLRTVLMYLNNGSIRKAIKWESED